jgi:hypothetical protein
MILATDMAKHFDILKTLNAIIDSGKFSLIDPEHRNLLMQVLLKCGDISNVSRPYDHADKTCDVICEEFFQHGDLEMVRGMEYTESIKDRAHLDKIKSQRGFFTYVCLPLFQSVAKVIPKLECNVAQVQSNIATWTARRWATSGTG